MSAGEIVAYAGSTAPSGWLLCDGSFVSQATYPDLFLSVGHVYNGGTDPGDFTFKLPDMRSRLPLGKGSSRLYLHAALAGTRPTDGFKINTGTDGSVSHSTADFERRAMTTALGTSETTVTATAGTADPEEDYVGRWSSPPLAAQVIPAGTWTLALVASESAAGADYVTGMGLYIWNPTGGSVRAYINNLSDIGWSPTRVEWDTTAKGRVSSWGSTGAVTVVAGDILVVETWVTALSPGISAVATIYFDGATPVVENVGSGAAASYLEGPGLLFQDGTGYGVGAVGGSASHTHTGPSHTHAVTQAAAHSDHSVGSPSNHASASHSGSTIADHAALVHSGFGASNHSVGQPTTHTDHDSLGGHQHNAHTTTNTFLNTSTNAFIGGASGSFLHTSAGAHIHNDGIHAHTGQALSAHSATQPDNHALQSHTVSAEATAHSAISHTAQALNAHSAHAGGATSADGTAASGGSDPPSLDLNYLVRVS